MPPHLNIVSSAAALRLWAFLLILAVLGVTPSVYAADSGTGREQLRRVGYLEAGHFWLFERTFQAFRNALQEHGIRADFPDDARFSPGWEPENMARLPQAAAALMQRDDLDLVVGMGTAAMKALLAANNGRTPIMGMGMADPVAAGVVAGPDDSGAENVTCHIVADRWSTMFRVFHDVVGFRTLGILYHDSPEGRVYAALDDARAVASELGFGIAEYGGLSSAETEAECRAGLDALRAQGMDAFFIGPLNCFDWQASNVASLLELLNGWGVPTFARDGSDFVRAGALMGFSTWNFGPAGNFLARQAAAVFNGTSPRAIPMLDRVEPTIAINLETAGRIGFIFPLDVLVVSDEIHERITLPAAVKEQ